MPARWPLRHHIRVRPPSNAGQEWGRYLGEGPPPLTRVDANEATRRLVSAMEDSGFAPEAVTKVSRRQVLLHRCPFREVAQEHPDVVCSIHLGLMKGLLTELGAPVVVDRLDPFVEPSQCVASLSRSTAGAGSSKRPRRTTTKSAQAASGALA